MSQVKLLLPKFHIADSALRSQSVGGVGFVRMLLHRRSAAGWAECMIYSALVSFFLVPVFCWKAEGDVSPSFGAGVAGLGCVLPRGPGSGESAVAHIGSPSRKSPFKVLEQRLL